MKRQLLLLLLTLAYVFVSCSKDDLKNVFQEIDTDYIVVTKFGVPNDGTPIGSDLNQLIKDAYGSTLYFPAGTYNLTEPIQTPYDYKKNVNLVFDKNAHITTEKNLEALLMVGFTELSDKVDAGLREFSYVEGGHFDATNAKRGIWINGYKQLVILKELSVYYCSGRHIEISRSGTLTATSTSCDTKIENVSIQGLSSNQDNYGIYIDSACADCKISDTFIYGTKCGIYTNTGGHILNNVHILSWRVGNGLQGDFSGTVGIKMVKQGFFIFNEVYFDTIERDFVIDGNIDIEMVVDKCITHSYLADFGNTFISWDNRTSSNTLQAKVTGCIFNLESKADNFKIFDLPNDVINTYGSSITFSDNVIRNSGKLHPDDPALM